MVSAQGRQGGSHVAFASTCNDGEKSAMGAEAAACVGENCSIGSRRCMGGGPEDIADDGRTDVGRRRRCLASAPRAPAESSAALRAEPLGVRL
eukprot:6302580-Amphidinium_carterae.4